MYVKPFEQYRQYCTLDMYMYMHVTVSVVIVKYVFTQELSSTMREGQPVYSGQEIIFTCVTRGCSIIAWSCDEYIGPGGSQLEFGTINSPGDRETSQINSDTVATLVTINGTDVLISTLRIITSADFPSTSVICHDANRGTRNTSTFQLGIQLSNVGFLH